MVVSKFVVVAVVHLSRVRRRPVHIIPPIPSLSRTSSSSSSSVQCRSVVAVAASSRVVWPRSIPSSILSSSSLASSSKQQHSETPPHRCYGSTPSNCSSRQGGNEVGEESGGDGTAATFPTDASSVKVSHKKHPPRTAGTIYRPPDSFSRIEDDDDDDYAGNHIGRRKEYLFLPLDDQTLKESIRSCNKEDSSLGYNDGIDDENDYDDISKKDVRVETKGRRVRTTTRTTATTTTTASRAAQAHSEYHKFDTEMSICFLGTGAGQPSRLRSTTATLLRLGGTAYLFDAGEGVQRQLQFTMSGKLKLVQKIFITHLHGDHIFGLPGLLLGIQNAMMTNESNAKFNSNSKRRPNRTGDHHNNNDMGGDHDNEMVVKVYGPPGLYHYVASSIILSCTKLHTLSIEVHELMGGRVRRASIPQQRGSGNGGSFGGGVGGNNDNMRNPFSDEYPEYTYGGQIRRIQVPCRNGVWTLEDLPPLTREGVMNHSRRRKGSGSSRGINHRRSRQMRIQAAEVDHLPGVVTFGYVIQEEDPPRNIDASKARELGVSSQQSKYELLKFGFPVEADTDHSLDGGATGIGSPVIVYPHQVLKPPTKKARKIAIIGDNREWTPQMVDIAKNATVLVHEATLPEADYAVRTDL
jgi:ribonuclease BN (tRNA processing enzyme)